MSTTRSVHLYIPSDVHFSDLRLARDPETRDLSFEWEPLEHICEASGIEFAQLLQEHEDFMAELIVAWYDAHRRSGGEPDPVQEQLIAEAIAEAQFGAASVQRGGNTLH
ncbi:MAG: hypothetical protein JWM42_3041 [Burkholderia sp.]|nr:hypothetical protein [Burkholderia sp.]